MTFLRVSVLVALAVIALLMAGVIAKIVKPQFPLFRYGFVLVGAVYLVFSFSHVDYFIAAYNLTHTSWEASGEETVDYSYLYTLSTDAAAGQLKNMREKAARRTTESRAGISCTARRRRGIK